ncbi:MAG: hypothetical protein FWC73_07405 [Defluviitaleaceae bacterium]|nr:hypothetical protein [Defluviitaleaceae bacterium]
MTSRERLMAVLRGGEADRLPWSPCIDSYFTDSLPTSHGGNRPDVVDAFRMIGADIMERHVPAANANWKNTEHEHIQDGNKHIWRITTPVGSLEQISASAGNTRSVTKHLVNSIEDLKVMTYIFERIECAPDYTYIQELNKRIGPDGIVTVSAEASPIKVIMELCAGLENTAFLLCDYQDEVEALIELIHQRNMERLKFLIDSPAEVIIAYEDTSTTVLSEHWYRKYSSPYINAYADMVSKSGKLFITHMCGKLKGFADLIKQDRMHGIDSVCPPDTGDMWAHEALELLPGKLIIGGIDPVALCNMTADETEEYVTRIIKATAPWKNFILSTGDAVAYGTPLGNLRRVTKIVTG